MFPGKKEQLESPDCRIGSSEIVAPLGLLSSQPDCRIGSSEKTLDYELTSGVPDCRIGSSEKRACWTAA